MSLIPYHEARRVSRIGNPYGWVCSLIVHLHLNRYPYSLILPHPKQPVRAGALCPGVFHTVCIIAVSKAKVIEPVVQQAFRGSSHSTKSRLTFCETML